VSLLNPSGGACRRTESLLSDSLCCPGTPAPGAASLRFALLSAQRPLLEAVDWGSTSESYPPKSRTLCNGIIDLACSQARAHLRHFGFSPFRTLYLRAGHLPTSAPGIAPQ